MKSTALLFAALFCAVFAFYGSAISEPTIANAQSNSPQVYITWRNVSGFAPASFTGKVIPGSNASMTASVEVITPSGKLADLSGQTIYWYLDGNFLDGGVGKQSITFAAPGHIEIMSLRVNIPDYPGGALINSVNIRMLDPQAVIIAPYPDGIFSRNSVEVNASPLFFNMQDINNLNYTWTVNGQPVDPGNNPLNLKINLNGSTYSGYELSINFEIKDDSNPLLSAAGNIILQAQ